MLGANAEGQERMGWSQIFPRSENIKQSSLSNRENTKQTTEMETFWEKRERLNFEEFPER